jgi:membrane-bound lytic murein transglycosylase MltF
MRAFETTGTVEVNNRLHLDHPISAGLRHRVKVIVLVPDSDEDDESAWLAAAANSEVFADLADPSEDVYTINDGRQFDGTR